MYAPPDCNVVDQKSALGEQLLHVTVEKREAQVLANRKRMTSSWNYLQRPETEGVSRSIEPACQITPAKLRHFLLCQWGGI
jgi:hypothetical protein